MRVLVLMATTLAMLGCGANGAAPANTELESLRAEVAALKAEAEYAKGMRDAHLKSIINLQNAMRINAPKKTIELDPSNTSYGILDGDLGKFAVSVQDVRQFADGVRVKLHLGNASSVNFSGATLHLQYGPRAPEDPAADDGKAGLRWLESLQQRDEAVTRMLAAGSWNPVQVTLPKISADRFGYLELSIETNQVQLRP